MPDLSNILATLKARASETARAIYVRHGAPEDRTLGVGVAQLKAIARSIRGQQELACALYGTGIFDAMYLAGMVADGSQLTREQMQQWAEAAAHMPILYGFTIPRVALEHPAAREFALKWTRSLHEHITAAGWAAYSVMVMTTPVEDLDLPEIEALLKRVVTTIDVVPDRVRAAMNGFVIAVGGYIRPLLAQALAAADQLGPIELDVGNTICALPPAAARIEELQASGRAGVKRRAFRC